MKKITTFFLVATFLVLLAAPIQAAAPISLIFSCHVGENNWGPTHGGRAWLDQVEKATGGRVKFECYWSSSLVKLKDTLKALQDGIIDVAIVGPGFYPGQQPLTEVSALPFLGAASSEQSSVVTWRLYEKFPELQAEHKNLGVKPLVFLNCDYHPMTTKKAGPIKTLEDFKGKKLRTIAGPPNDSMRALGAAPLYVPINDLYVALEKGVVDGGNLPWETVPTGYKMAEVTAYQTDVNIFFGVYSFSISLKAWNRLPKDIQEAIMSVSGEKGSVLASGWFDTAKAPSLALYKKMAADGKTREVIEVPDSEVERWREVGGKPIWDQWLKKMEDEGKGPAAKKILAEQLEMIRNYSR